MIGARRVEALVAVVGVAVTLAAWLFWSVSVALATGVAALISVLNFALSRYSIKRALGLRAGRARLQPPRSQW